MRVGIVGAGIAGLSAAIALGREHDVVVFEQAEDFGAVGAGIVVSANAGRALRSIGVHLDDVGRRVATSTLALADGSVLQRLDLAAGEHRWGATVAVSRHDLHATLAAALPASVQVRLGCRIEAIDVDHAAVVANDTRHEFDLLVGADGIGSRVRAVMEVRSRIVPAGVACWRALVPVPTDHDPVEYVGTRRRIGVVGLSAGTYLYLVESARPTALRDLDLPALRERFAEVAAARDLVDALTVMPRFDDLAELDRPAWGDARTMLIGDAAHAMTPNLGQGASMAIEDAVTLASLLRAGSPGWFEAFVEQRGPRVRWVQRTSRRLGKLLHVGPAPARLVRDAVLRRTPASVMRRQTERLLAEGPVPAGMGRPRSSSVSPTR